MEYRKGMTLLEVVFAITLIVFLVSAISFVYIVSLRGWTNLGHHSDVHEKLHFGLERIVRDVRGAKAMSIASHALRFTLYEGGVDNSYIYYLYNPSDPWIPAYNQTNYDLRRTSLSGGIGGTFTYGSGEIIITNLKPPNSTTITSSGNVASLTLVGQAGDDALTVRGYVRPRNV